MRKLILCAAAGLATLALSGNVLAADVTMRISLQLPMKSHLGQNLALFEKEVETKSNGAIDVEIYDSARGGNGRGSCGNDGGRPPETSPRFSRVW